MATRVKKTIEDGIRILNRETAERAVGELADAIFQRDNLRSEMERQMLAVRTGFENQIFDLDLEIKVGVDRLEKWAVEFPTEFGGKRSIDMIHGTIGFRTCPPALKTISKWTFAKVVDALKAAGMARYIRTKEEVDKDAILAANAAKTDEGESKLPAEKLRLVGLVIKQDEQFFVEPKREAF